MESTFRNSDVMSEGDYSETMDTNCAENVIISNEPHLTRNPLLNYLVVTRLFEHFNLQEIKNGRLVCKEWNSAAQESLRKRSKIIFTNTKIHVPKFWNTFHASHSKHPFTHFEFKEDFFVREASHILKIYGPFIKVLKLDRCNVKFQQPDGTIKSHRRVDSSRLISKCINLTELDVNCSRGSKQCISIRHLLSVKELKLFNCDILLEKDIKISPTQILLSQTNYFVNANEMLPEIVLNNIFDFHKTKRVLINQIGATPSILDVGQGVAQVGGMTLMGVTIINWEKSNWSINGLTPDRLSIVNKITMNIKSLTIANTGLALFGPGGTEIIDFSKLPATLEKLHFTTQIETEFISSTPVDLPNLKHLTIRMYSHVSDFPISHFTNCPNLNTLSLKNHSSRQSILDVNLLPRNIKKLDINKNITIVNRAIDAGEKFRINMLVFRGRSLSVLSDCANVLEYIQPDILFLFFGGRECSWDEIVQFVYQNVHLNTIFVNSFVPNPPVDRTRNVNPTDNRPEFSVFENTVCRPITRKEFTRVINISNAKDYNIYE